MRRPVTISASLHAFFIAALILSGSFASRSRHYPPVYQVNLIAAPAAETLRPDRRRPQPRPADPEPEEKPATAPEPEPEILEEEEELVPEEPTEPAPEEPEPVEEGLETEAPPEEEIEENPVPDAGGNDAELDLKIEGKPFPFPGYLERLVNKIGRNWKKTPNKKPLAATAYFRVERDGKVTSMEIYESSDDFLFDQAALRAIADASPMPPLPEGYTSDYLGVYFDFNEEPR
ncbi:MAG: TonB C-terminal domain-containing protein [Gemmatimonadetes bacterium]|nr:TonB C-terminal domain-containing protein [Gemmatimonadota bacterium]